MVFIPGLSRRSPKGGGGKGGGGGGKTSGGGASSGGSRSSALSGTSRTSSTYGSGGGSATTIGSGSLFAGRTQGGGTRGQVFGTSAYGSGYPGVAGRGTASRNFPFFYWPVVWGSGFGVVGGAYLYTHEYGEPNNSSRPGGVLLQTTFSSNASNTTFHLIADNETSVAIVPALTSNCSSVLASNSSSATPQAFDPNQRSQSQPESVVQYYRASSVALTLDNYNNSAVFSSDENAPPSPLPSGVDQNLLNCLNETVGAAVPLVDASLPAVVYSPVLLILGVLIATNVY